MSKKGGRRKTVWIFAGIFAGMLLTAFIAISSQMGKIVVSELTKLTKEKSGGLYELRIEKAQFNLFSGKIKVKEASLSPNSSVLGERYAQNNAPAATVNVRLETFHIKLSHWISSLKSKKFAIEYIDLRAPHIVIVQDTALLQRRKALTDDSAKNPIKRFLASSKFNKIVLKDGFFELKTTSTPDRSALIVDGINAEIDGVGMDSTFLFQNSAIPYWNSADVSIKNVSYTFPGEHIRLEVNQFIFNDKDSFLSWDSLALIPLHEKYEYAEKTPRQSDWMTVQTKKVDFMGIDLKELFSENALFIEKVFISDFYFSSFKNRKVPPIVPPVKPLFHRLIHEIPFEFHVPDITVETGKAEYEELALHAHEPGKLLFTNIHLLFSELTNRPTEEHQCVKINGKTKIMGEGDFSGVFELPLHPDDQNFKITGYLDALDFRSFNPMLEPMANIFVERGAVDNAYFTIMGTDNVASIDYLLLYHDLKVDILNKEGHKSGLASKIVNNYVLIPSNPEGKEDQRSARASVVRDIHRSNFQFWWSAIFAGTKETIGFTKEMEENLKSLKTTGEKIKEEFSKKH